MKRVPSPNCLVLGTVLAGLQQAAAAVKKG